MVASECMLLMVVTKTTVSAILSSSFLPIHTIIIAVQKCLKAKVLGAIIITNKCFHFVHVRSYNNYAYMYVCVSCYKLCMYVCMYVCVSR